MKPGSITPVIRLLGLTALSLLIAACGRDPAATSSEPVATTPAATPQQFRKLHIHRADGGLSVTFRWNDEEVQVLWGDGERKRSLRSGLSAARQRRYSERGVGPVALVRTNPELPGFTLRTLEAEIRWRVRMGKRMLLFENSDDEPIFDLRQPNEQVVRVKGAGEVALGKVTFPSSRVRVSDAEGVVLFKVTRKAPASALYGLLLAPDLDEVDRYILMAELLVRGR